MPRLKEAGREAGNPYADAIFNLLFGDRDPVADETSLSAGAACRRSALMEE